MIGRLRGTLAALTPMEALLEVSGCGYRVLLGPSTIAGLPGVGEEVVVHTHLHVREDALTLYGFPSARARDTFETLLLVNGVGPKVALAICSVLDPDQLGAAVARDDADALTLVPGIGPKTARKILLELRDRLGAPENFAPAVAALGQVREALEGLGYGTGEVRDALADVDPSLPVEQALRHALQALGRNLT